MLAFYRILPLQGHQHLFHIEVLNYIFIIYAPIILSTNDVYGKVNYPVDFLVITEKDVNAPFYLFLKIISSK